MDGTLYSFSVSAINIIGEGKKSSSTSVTTNIVSPSEPTITSAIPGYGSVLLKWSIPLSTGGSDITSYNIYYTQNGQTEVINVESFNSFFTFATETNIDGLLDGTLYSFSVSAINITGEGKKSSSISVTTFGVPSQPSIIFANPVVNSINTTNNSANLNWTSPYNGGLNITGYNIYIEKDNQIIRTIFVNTTTATVSQLLYNNTYKFYVSAINIIGESLKSSYVQVTTILSVPTPPSIKPVAYRTSIDYSWDVPKSNGGSSITGYKIYLNNNQPILFPSAITKTSYQTFKNLLVNTYYSISISAINTIGESERSTYIILSTNEVPSAPVFNSVSYTYSVGGSTENGFYTIYLDWDNDANNKYYIFYPSKNRYDSIGTIVHGNSFITTSSVSGDLTFYLSGVNSLGQGDLGSVTVNIPPETADITNQKIAWRK